MLRAFAFALLGVMVIAVSGCNDTKKIEAMVASYKAEMDPQMQLMVRHSKFLQKKAETIAAKVEKLEAENAQMSQALAALTYEPQAAKRDILAYVDARADTLAMFQKNSLEEFGHFLNQRDVAVRQTLQAQDDSLKAALASADEFFRFVMSDQDTVNQAFAQRLDQKPWYNSILGRWEKKKSTHH
jgi:hypothetical protein